MKNLFIFAIVLLVTLTGFSQKRALLPNHLKNYAVIKSMPAQEIQAFNKEVNPLVKNSDYFFDEVTIGNTRYDNQNNGSMQNRMYLFNDGTIGTTWIYGIGEPNYDNRGTGYNYFDGTSWGEIPSARVEDVRTGWPSYAPLGANGEIVISHTGASGLYISKRDQKGTGSWSYSPFAGPDGHHMLWNRSITSGINHNRIHIFGLTAPIAYSGTPYENLDGALVYSLSTDGGETWEIENQILDGMTSNEYYGFASDNYTWAEPKGDVLAFVVGESWIDMFLMKSIDGGQTFSKTLIWENPYPLFNTQAPEVTDTFYCADGAHSLVIDDNNIVHVVFGINRAQSDGTNMYWFPFVDGIGYWNENMPGFSNNLNALSPYGDPGTELIEDVNLIGWTQDVDGDGQITFIGNATENIGTYYLGLSSMPQLVINNNDLYLIYSSTTETYYTGTINYRHLWERYSTDGGATWGDFTDLTSGLIHTFDECVYPSCAANSDEFLYLIYQQDNSPGNFVWANQHPADDNNIIMMKVPILGTGLQNSIELKDKVSQNFPNPFRTTSEVYTILDKPADLTLEVIDLTGNKVYETFKPNARPGNNTLIIDASNLSPGIYFYTVKSEGYSVTKKMIVE
jgi:hypothetical protein